MLLHGKVSGMPYVNPTSIFRFLSLALHVVDYREQMSFLPSLWCLAALRRPSKTDLASPCVSVSFRAVEF